MGLAKLTGSVVSLLKSLAVRNEWAQNYHLHRGVVLQVVGTPFTVQKLCVLTEGGGIFERTCTSVYWNRVEASSNNLIQPRVPNVTGESNVALQCLSTHPR